jgi:metallo-beta-lactamase class B
VARALRLFGLLLLGLVGVAFALLVPQWQAAGDRGGQQPAEPFRIAGDFYFVGASDVSSFLIAGPEGHVLIDGGYAGTPPMILDSIAKLGFDIRDVKVLLNGDPHLDHAGGLAALKEASGAELWASETSADVIESGGDDPDDSLPLRVLTWINFIDYPPAEVDHRFKDGDPIRVGPIEITAHVTGGHARGCTTYSFAVLDEQRVLNVVATCSLNRMGFTEYPNQTADFERTFRLLRSLPVDIWVTEHGRLWGRYRKFVASMTAENPADAFVDPEGWRAFIDAGEDEFRRGVTH